MPKGKKANKTGPKVTLKAAKQAIQQTPEGCRRLTLSRMGLITFPKCLLKLTNIDEMDLSCNLLQTLPNTIGDFLFLKKLDLHSNKLESLPESIGNLRELTDLNLFNNRLTSESLPFSLGSLTSLESLNLGMNQLDTLPSTLVSLTNLQELGLLDNLLDKLPEFVADLPNLTNVKWMRSPSPQKECEKELHLVHEKNMCKECRKKVKEDGSSDSTFCGVKMPNSVARAEADE